MVAYLLASLALIVKPGPDLMCLLATALAEGRKPAVALMLGQMFGCWLWILLLPLGVATFFTAHPAVMVVIQIIGIVYIGYLAYLSLKEAIQGFRKEGDVDVLEGAAVLTSSVEGCLPQFRRGVAMAMSNPLTILFFLAFLPHFTSGDSMLSPALKTFLLGTLFCALVPFVDIPVILAAGVFRARLAGNGKFLSVLKSLSGIILLLVVALLIGSVRGSR